jgi:hypothetical protein
LNKIWHVGGGDIHYPQKIVEFTQSELGKTTPGMTAQLLNNLPKGKINLKASMIFGDEDEEMKYYN